jgi:hypothetical protein
MISVLDLQLAQRLGLQEGPESADPLFIRLEGWTARWDLAWLWTLPVAGVLILLDQAWWPFAAMIGGSAFIDTAGREGAKWFGLRRQGIAVGTPREQRTYVGGLTVMLVLGLLAAVTGLLEAT